MCVLVDISASYSHLSRLKFNPGVGLLSLAAGLAYMRPWYEFSRCGRMHTMVSQTTRSMRRHRLACSALTSTAKCDEGAHICERGYMIS